MKNKLLCLFGILSACTLVSGIYMKTKTVRSVSIIGGADGPTSIFIAGRVGDGFTSLILGIGLCCLIGAVVLLFRNKKKDGKE